MFKNHKYFYLAALLLSGLTAYAQNDTRQSVTAGQNVFVDVIVTKNKQWVTDLEEKDFKLFDRGSVRPITSFNAVPIKDGELYQYELTFEAAMGKKPNDYHPIKVCVDRLHLSVRVAPHGYYAQP
jgi:hypothetical protein